MRFGAATAVAIVLVSGNVGGVLLLVATAYLTWLGRSVPSWPQVRGTITKLTADEFTGEYGDSWIRRKLQYTYEVSQRRYVSGRVRFGFYQGPWSENYGAVAERLAVGESVTVWHHPRWPWLSTLQPQGTPGATVLVVAGLLYVVDTVTGWDLPHLAWVLARELPGV